MIKYIFWAYVLALAILLSFEQTARVVTPLAFVSCIIYSRWVNGSVATLAKYIAKRYDTITDSINSNISMINEHTKLLKRLVPIEKLIPPIQRKVDRVEKETHRNTENQHKTKK